MISVTEALQILNENISIPTTEIISISKAHDRRLSDDIHAPESSPRYTNSAMDGYAVRWQDCATASTEQSTRLKVIGESQAGIPFDGVVAPNTAIRISTGAMLPEGADTIVRVEDTRETLEYVEICSIKTLGMDVRHEGEEFNKGSLLLAKGTTLGARELALLVAVGQYKVPVYVPPQVALLVTGTELAPPDTTDIKSHQIRDSNSIMLAAAARESGASISTVSHIKDSLEQTIAAVRRASETGDRIILCSGGVSVGKHDHVKEAAIAVGFKELFWKISQKPGKPLFVCRLKDTLLFGLPGNPVSAFMCFINYVRPVLVKLQGGEEMHQSITAKTTNRISNSGSRTSFIRVTVENKPNQLAVIKEMAQQGSHMLSTIVHADGYIVLDPGQILEPEELIEVFLF
jgi:molybdopterin molybdotransferase